MWPPRSHERINIHLAKSSHCEMLVLWQLASSSTLPFCSPTPLSAHIKHNHNIQPPSCQKLGWALSGYLGSGHELQVVIVRVSRHCQGTSSSGCFRCGHCGKCKSTTRACLRSPALSHQHYFTFSLQNLASPHQEADFCVFVCHTNMRYR